MEPSVITRPRRPRAAMVAAHESAAAVFAALEPGTELLCLTHGQFSLVDALTAILDRTGPADVAVSTWSAAKADLLHAEKFLADGRIRSLRFVVDRSFATRQPDYCATLVKLFGPESIRSTALHAKFAVVSNDAWHVAVRTSMNLNENRRMEYVEVSDDAEVAGFFLALVDELFTGVAAGDMNNYGMPDAGGRFAPAPRLSGTNAAELEATLAELRRMGRLERVDSARVQMARSMASVLDDDPAAAALWRQYREVMGELTADDGDSGEADRLIAELSAPVLDTPPA
jgi:hypothetical protein